MSFDKREIHRTHENSVSPELGLHVEIPELLSFQSIRLNCSTLSSGHACRGMGHVVALLRFCVLGSGVELSAGLRCGCGTAVPTGAYPILETIRFRD